jgi:hypothetical protein
LIAYITVLGRDIDYIILVCIQHGGGYSATM